MSYAVDRAVQASKQTPPDYTSPHAAFIPPRRRTPFLEDVCRSTFEVGKVYTEEEVETALASYFGRSQDDVIMNGTTLLVSNALLLGGMRWVDCNARLLERIPDSEEPPAVVTVFLPTRTDAERMLDRLALLEAIERGDITELPKPPRVALGPDEACVRNPHPYPVPSVVLGRVGEKRSLRPGEIVRCRRDLAERATATVLTLLSEDEANAILARA